MQQIIEKLIEKAKEDFNKELINASGSNLTKLCYAEGYLDALKEVEKWIGKDKVINKD